MKKIILIAATVLFCLSSIYGFETGKDPTKAMLLSLAIPGGGQLYNESYYKAAGVFSLQAYFIGQTVYHHNLMNDYRDKMKEASGADKAYYRAKSNRLYDKRQNDFWWLGSILFLSVVDAFVDAHLYNFEEKKDEVHLIFDNEKIGVSLNF